LSPRAKEFYNRVFRSAYTAIENTARQTPLVIMLWGPRRRSREWSIFRQRLSNTLLQLGHDVFFSEQLGISTAAMSQKGVEFLQSETADAIIAMQSLYDAVGTVHHFVELRVISAKMLLFIDAAAPDRNLYERAIADMNARYNNVETYKFPEDITGGGLIGKISSKVSTLQMVKYRALQNGKGWGLDFDAYTMGAAQPHARVQPFRYNLLELYYRHREEIDILSDPAALFLLSFVQQIGAVTAEDLAREVGISPQALLQRTEPLRQREMLTETDGMLRVTRFGKSVLEGVGLDIPAQMPPSAKQPARRWKREVSLSVGIGAALASIVLVALAVLYGANIIASRLPRALTPSHTIAAPTRGVLPTVTPTVAVTPPAR
jgi:hypothetical protein